MHLAFFLIILFVALNKELTYPTLHGCSFVQPQTTFMARIFNIYFLHENELHNAIVSVRSTPLSTEYLLGNLDVELRSLLPGDCILWERAGSLAFKDANEKHSTQLMEAIIQSLTIHLQTNHTPL